MLTLGIVCYPTYGGSGVIAAEIGMELARRGHQVHFISSDIPRRLKRFQENVYFHEVEAINYPLLAHPHYTLGLTSKIVEVAQQQKLDILHAHYAVPHATAAYLARQILGERAPKIITTLHGTDITLVGNDRSYLPITRFSVMQSDGITAVSQYLRQATYDKLSIPTQVPIEVIPNFVNTQEFSPERVDKETTRRFICQNLANSCKDRIVCHISNFRAVKRIPDVIRVFAEVRKELPSVLVLVGDGPERSAAETLTHELNIVPYVKFLGKQDAVSDVLSCCDVFLLPSQSESFGLGALEAMALGIPVVATNVGGLPEVVVEGKTGFLHDPGDVHGMAGSVKRLLSDTALHKSLGQAARDRALNEFPLEPVVSRYESFYLKTLGR